MLRVSSRITDYGKMTPYQSAFSAGLVTNFVPSDVAGLALWLKQDTLSLADTDPVTIWADQSSNAYSATPPGNAPTWDATEKAVRFTASNSEKLALPSTTPLCLGSGGNIFIVLKMASLPAVGDLSSVINKFNSAPGGSGYDLRHYNNGGALEFDALWASFSATAAMSISTTSYQLMDTELNATNALLTVNAAQLADVAGGSITTDTKDLNIGGFGFYTASGTDLGRYFDGWIKEIIVYNGALSAEYSANVRRYLNGKYGLY